MIVDKKRLNVICYVKSREEGMQRIKELFFLIRETEKKECKELKNCSFLYRNREEMQKMKKCSF